MQVHLPVYNPETMLLLSIFKINRQRFITQPPIHVCLPFCLLAIGSQTHSFAPPLARAAKP